MQDLQEKYDAYKTKYPYVKLYFVFNQPLFSPGDTVFFQSWYLNEEFVRVKSEHVVTLDLFDGAGHSRQKVKFKVKNGSGHSQLVINKDLPPGEYQIIAYTDWMRNFGESWFYKKRLQVVSTKQVENAVKPGSTVKFFPEGGSLIAGTVNRVAVLGPPSTQLEVRNSSGVGVASVSLDSTGLGSFKITPDEGLGYYTEWPQGGRNWKLPISKKDGISVVMESEDNFTFSLSLPAGSRLMNSELFAVVNSQDKIKFRQKIVLSDTQQFRLQVPIEDTRGSLHQFLIFDAQGKVLAERLFFPRSQKIAAQLNVSATAPQRGRISGTVLVKDASGGPLDSELSVLVYQSDLFGNKAMGADLYFSDLPEVADRAEKYNVIDRFSLNDFLICQKWDVFDWDEILGKKSITLTYPFYGEQRLKGKVVSKKTGEAPPDSTAVIGYLQANTVGYEAYTRDGKFEMTLIYDFWGEDKVFCTLKNKNKSLDDSYDIIIVDDSLTSTNTWTAVETEQRSRYGEYAINRSIVTRSYNFFQAATESSTARDLGANAVFEDEFLGADYEVNVEEYMTFPSMIDLLQEAVPFVRYRKRGDKETIRMSYRYEKNLKVFKDDPLYIIDGLMTRNTAYFMSLKPEQLLFIKILNNPNKLTQLGKLGENAVIFVESKKGDLYKAIEGENIFPVVGLSRAREFFELDHSKSGLGDRVPDMRSTLYWKPSAESKSGVVEFNFFASDDIGPMKVVVRGFTKDGRPFTAEKEITVVFNAEK